MRFIFTAIILIVSLQFLFAQNEPIELNWQFGKPGSNLGKGGLLTVDLDGDGKSEIITSGVTFDNSWNALGYISIAKYNKEIQTYEIKWVSRLFFSEITALNIYDFDKDGISEIYIGLNNGSLIVYNGKTLKEVEQIKVTNKKSTYYDPIRLTDIEFGDIDNNGAVDLVILINDSTFYYDSSYSLTGKIPFGSDHCKIGNVDDSPNLEVIYSDGRIIELKDGEILEKKSINIHLYNKRVDIGLSDFNNDGVQDIVYSSTDSVYVINYRAELPVWKTTWETKYPFEKYIGGLWLFDYNGDGIKDVFVGERTDGWIYCYNGANGVEEFKMFISNGIVSAAFADTDNDLNLELIWTTGANDIGPEYFFVYDLSTREEEWKSKDFTRDYSAFDIGDFDNDGELDIVAGNYGYYLQNYPYGFVSVLNAATKTLKWQNDDHLGFNFEENFSAVKIGDVDNDGENELLLGVESRYPRSYVYIFNPDHSVERHFEIDGMDIILGIEIADLDMDGKNEVIVTSGSTVGGRTNPKDWQNYIYIFDGETGRVKWKSLQLGGDSSKIGSLAVGNIDEDEALEVVALQFKSGGDEEGSLIIIDGKTYALDKTQMSINAVSLVDFDHDGINELVIGDEEGNVSILNGASYEVTANFKVGSGTIHALKAVDLNKDSHYEFVVTDAYKLYIYDTQSSYLKWYSDTLSSSVGKNNSLIVGDLDGDQLTDIVLNVGHALYNFEIQNYETLEVVEEKHKAIANVHISGLNQEFSGEPKPVVVSTIPAGLNVIVTYNGSETIPIKTGEYQVSAVVKDENYEGEARAVLNIHGPTALPANKVVADLSLVPNPTSGITKLVFPTGCKANITVSDLSGRIIQQTKITGSYEFDLRPYSAGMYLVKINIKDEPSFILKLLKE